jgi:hypothetical protein
MGKLAPWLCVLLAASGCVGHQTFDDGSDAVKRRPMVDPDAGRPALEPSAEGPTAPSDDAGDTDAAPEVTDAGAVATVRVDASIAGGTLPVAVGAQILLTLRTIGPGNYADAQVDGDAVEYLGSDYAEIQNPGGPTQWFEFRAARVGTATITVPHSVQSTPVVFDIVVE